MTPINYLSVCSGIESWSVACRGLPYKAAGFAEIDPYASAVLAKHWPEVRNFGDMTTIPVDDLGPVDVLVGGTPCQSFSFAGQRQSLDDARGNLALAYGVLVHELARSHGLRNAIWENVPGVLSMRDNAFGCFLAEVVGHNRPIPAPRGGGWPGSGMVDGPRGRAAWRVLDAQYFGLAQRRERVFVVIDTGGGADPAAVLFERQGLHGNIAPRRDQGKDLATATAGRSGGGRETLTVMAHGQAGAEITDDHSPTLTCVHEAPILFMADIVGTLPSGGNQTGGDRPPGTGAETAAAGYLIAFDTTQVTSPDNRSNPRAGDPCHPLAATAHPPAVAFPSFSAATQHITVEELSPTLGATTPMAVAYSLMPQNSGKDFKARQVEVAQPLLAGGPTGGNQGGDLIQQGWKVRRLTPNECARLQGFPDDHARIAWNGRPAERCPDGPQYKAYGNAMAVNVMRWLAERLAHELNRKDGR